MKITKITQKIPKEIALEDGIYHGIWGGYVIEVNFKGKTYELTTEEGVKGIGIKVMIFITNGIATFETIKN